MYSGFNFHTWIMKASNKPCYGVLKNYEIKKGVVYAFLSIHREPHLARIGGYTEWEIFFVYNGRNTLV